MENVTELASQIGKTGTINNGGLEVKVKVLNIKKSYGRTRYLVTPVEGKNEVWVEGVNLN